MQALKDGGAEYDPANLVTQCRGCYIVLFRGEVRARFPQAAAERFFNFDSRHLVEVSAIP